VTAIEKQTVCIAVESLDQILAAMPQCDNEEAVVRVMEILTRNLKGAATQSEATLVALLAVALVRLKELERL
jgi:hypothetical protein